MTDDNILEAGECWTWDYTTNPAELIVTIDEDTTFTAKGSGTADSVVVDWTNDGDEEDSVLVEVEEGFTRTWGFWKTHLYLVQYIFDLNGDGDPANDLVALPIDLGIWPDINGDPEAKLINTVCEYMGLMWSKQSHNSGGGKRAEQIDAARVHAAHQALAAIMNSYMPNGAPLPVTLEYIRTTLGGNDIQLIRELGSILAGYNESGEDVALDPSLPATGMTTGNVADPQGGREVGATCQPFWDTPEATKGGPKGGPKGMARGLAKLIQAY
jgi:hypothetical protein